MPPFFLIFNAYVVVRKYSKIQNEIAVNTILLRCQSFCKHCWNFELVNSLACNRCLISSHLKIPSRDFYSVNWSLKNE